MGPHCPWIAAAMAARQTRFSCHATLAAPGRQTDERTAQNCLPDPAQHRWSPPHLKPGSVATLETPVRLWTETTAQGKEQNAELTLLLHVPDKKGQNPSVRLRTRFVYRTTDPYAVEAHFIEGTDDETVWVFARDLLIEGLERRTGVGDVTVWPQSVPGIDKPRVFISLTAPEGTALLSADSGHLKAFLDSTRNLVGYGNEHTQMSTTFAALEYELGQLTCPGAND